MLRSSGRDAKVGQTPGLRTLLWEGNLLIETERLVLMPVTAELVHALGEGRATAERLLDARIPDDFPDADLGGFLPIYAESLAADPSGVGYGPWIAVSRDERLVVANGGFFGKPADDGSVELGYATQPDQRNRGYASEVAGALVEWGLEQPNVKRIIARCDPTNHASIRVLEKLGMQRGEVVDGQIVWEVLRGPR
jgi:ribosomal-protein-alanine N-acetyltransferase